MPIKIQFSNGKQVFMNIVVSKKKEVNSIQNVQYRILIIYSTGKNTTKNTNHKIFLFSSSVSDGILTDNPHLVLLFYLSQLFLRELIKCYRLIQVVPMDMSGYYGKCLQHCVVQCSVY